MSHEKQKSRSPALRCGAMVGNSGLVVRLRKHRGANVPSYYVAIYTAEGSYANKVLTCGGDSWWTKAEAKAAGERWIAEQAKPSPNIGDEPTRPQA